MKPLKASGGLVAAAAIGLLCACPALAQGPAGHAAPDQGQPRQQPGGPSAPLDPNVKRTFVPLGVPAALYEPVAPGEKSRIGIFVMHSGANYITFSACTELSKRGYTVLCSANSAGPGLDRIVADARPGVAYLRQHPGIRKVVLFGHSGGATLMTAYQLIAEGGVSACQGPARLLKCSDTLAGLPAADGVVLADANWGNAEMALFSVDPAVLSNDSGMTVNPDLDLWNPKNGFDAAGSHYSKEFVRAFQAAVAKKENALIRTALDRLSAIESGKGRFADDEPFVVAGASSVGANNKLFVQDTRLMSRTRKAWPLLHPDGSVTTQVVETVRVPEGARSLTPSLGSGAINSTVRTFLTNSAIRVSDDFGYDESSVWGVDWTSSYSSVPGNVEGITVPLLLMGMTGHWEYLAAETIYEHARSSDKTLVFVEGANHGYTPCRPCEKSPGQFGDTQRTTYDYVDRWLAQKGRF